MADGDKEDSVKGHQYMVRANAGAVRAGRTGIYSDNMGYVFGTNPALASEHILQSAIAATNLFEKTQTEYHAKLRAWDQDGRKGEMPKFEQNEELAKASFFYSEVVKSAEIRSNLYRQSLDTLTVKQGMDAMFHDGKLPINVSNGFYEMIRPGLSTPIGKAEGKIKDAMAFINNYYIDGETARNVEAFKLGSLLEGLVAADDYSAENQKAA